MATKFDGQVNVKFDGQVEYGQGSLTKQRGMTSAKTLIILVFGELFLKPSRETRWQCIYMGHCIVCFVCRL